MLIIRTLWRSKNPSWIKIRVCIIRLRMEVDWKNIIQASNFQVEFEIDKIIDKVIAIEKAESSMLLLIQSSYKASTGGQALSLLAPQHPWMYSDFWTPHLKLLVLLAKLFVPQFKAQTITVPCQYFCPASVAVVSICSQNDFPSVRGIPTSLTQNPSS